MRQRVVIAIAMANNPDIILADEPTTALDVTVQAQVLQSLRTALDETHAALLLITHDLGVIAGLADRVLVMYAGRTVEHGTVDDIFYRPAMPYTVGLLGSLPRLDVDGSQRLRPIPGSPPSMLGLGGGCPFAPRCPLRAPICDEEEPPLRVVNHPVTAEQTLSPPGVASMTSILPAQSSEAGPALGGDDVFAPHVAACHFADHVASGAAGDIFEPTSADLDLVVEK
jgi:peptide/nickel transport system ATP-binding protein